MGLSRSEQMSRIHGRDTAPERILRKLLWHSGIRYRLHAKTPGGRPDLVIRTSKVAIFIDGCFWHGCPEHYVRPRTRNEFWEAKLGENVARDRRQTLALDDAGWRVLRIWEHELLESPENVATRVRSFLKRAGRVHVHSSPRVVRVELLDVEGHYERRFLQDLRSDERTTIVERRRSTRKVGRVR